MDHCGSLVYQGRMERKVLLDELSRVPGGRGRDVLRLWVDVVWSRERPLGLGARRYVELMRADWQMS